MYGIKFLLSKENILNRITEYDIFRYYEPNFEKIGKKFKSTWRGEKIPSSVIRNMNGTLFYKDYGDPNDKSYTCFTYLQERYSLDYNECLTIINNDFQLGLNSVKTLPTLGFYGVPNKKVIVEEKKDTVFQIKKRDFNNRDLEFWNKYGITETTLNKFNVFSISHYFINGLPFEIKKNELAFAYYEAPYKYKIYLPNRPKGEKFWSNTGGIVQGYSNLPESGDKLYITSSKKDIMCLYECGLISVAPSSENSRINLSVIQELKDRFKQVILYYNNDKPGIEAAINHSKLYEIPYIYNPIGTPKDPSDYTKEKSLNELKLMLENEEKNIYIN